MDEFNFDTKFQHPFTMLISGTSGSGKSVFTKKLVAERVSPKLEKVFWFYGEWQPTYADAPANVTFVPGMPASIDTYIDGVQGPKAVVFDDLMMKAADSEMLAECFTQKRHHHNLSVVLILQNLFIQGRMMRSVQLNTQYMVLLNNPRDKSQIATLARQVEPGRASQVVKAYSDATSKKYGNFLIDLKPETPEQLRYRSDVLNDIQSVYKLQ